MLTVVVGAGRMGHGLGLSYALGGHDVILVDRDRRVLTQARGRVEAAAAILVDNDLATTGDSRRALERIRFTDDLTEACAAVDLVQETIPEDLREKQVLLGVVEALVPANAIIATNTSSLRVGALAVGMRRPERLVGLHWVAPPYLVPIVEVVRGGATMEGIVSRAVRILEDVGKVPIVVPDTPGFAVNRLQYALFAAAVDLVDRGIVGPEQIDLIVRYAMAPRQLAFGQFQLFDLIVSGRTVLEVANYLYAETGDARYQPSPRLAQLVQAGRLGLASGAGWYEYAGDPADIERQRDRAFASAYRALDGLDRQRGADGRGRRDPAVASPSEPVRHQDEAQLGHGPEDEDADPHQDHDRPH